MNRGGHGLVDLPTGGVAGNILALTPLRVDARGNVGLKSPGDAKTVRAGAEYEGRFLRIGATEPEAIVGEFVPGIEAMCGSCQLAGSQLGFHG
jgi:hypothetical protein